MTFPLYSFGTVLSGLFAGLRAVLKGASSLAGEPTDKTTSKAGDSPKEN